MSVPIPLLSASGLAAGYGASQVLFGIDLEIATGQVVTLLGRNGMGKSTTIKTLIGDLLTRQVTECFGFKPDGSYSMRHLPVGHDEPLRAELIAFLDAVRSGKLPAVSGDEGVASLEIAIRCLESPARPAASTMRKGPRRVAG